MSELYMIIGRKKYFPEFWWRLVLLPAPISYAYGRGGEEGMGGENGSGQCEGTEYAP